MQLKLMMAATAMGVTAVAGAVPTVDLPGHGEVRLEGAATSAWTIEFSRSDRGETDGLFEVRLAVRSDQPAMPPPLKLVYTMEHRDVAMKWSPNGNRLPLPWSEEMGVDESKAIGQLPVLAFISQTDMNRLTVACSDALGYVEMSGWESEFGGSKLHISLALLKQVPDPIAEYSVRVRFDFRDLPYWDTIPAACDYVVAEPGNQGAPTPAVAYAPLWNSWYGYHTSYTAEDMEREGRIAAELGIGTVMYDMGWSGSGPADRHDFTKCGDWLPDPKTFPDMKAHLKYMHDLKLKCILWCGISLIGKHSQAESFWKDYTLTEGPTEVLASSWILDPRFPAVRKHITDTLVRGVRDWGADGWKIDFIQHFHLYQRDKADAGMNGRDLRSVSDAALVLQEEFSSELRKVNPEVMFEFMFAYGGARGQKAATQLRAGDCPADAVWNRNQTARLRLLSGQRAAVHSDMLTWSPEESPEACARQIISSLHAVIQYGMRLTALTAAQKEVVKFWTGFQRRHAQTLFQGAFRPHGAVHSYPLIEMESAAERILTVHQQDLAARLVLDRQVMVINGTGAVGVPALADRAAQVEYFDCRGCAIGSSTLAKGASLLAIPDSGFAVVTAATP